MSPRSNVAAPERVAQSRDVRPPDLVDARRRQLQAPVEYRDGAVGGEAEPPEAVPRRVQEGRDQDERDVPGAQNGDAGREAVRHVGGADDCGRDREGGHAAELLAGLRGGIPRHVADTTHRALSVEDALAARQLVLAAAGHEVHPLPLQEARVVQPHRAIAPARGRHRLVALEVPHCFLELVKQVELRWQSPRAVQERSCGSGLQRLPPRAVGLVERRHRHDLVLVDLDDRAARPFAAHEFDVGRDVLAPFAEDGRLPDGDAVLGHRLQQCPREVDVRRGGGRLLAGRRRGLLGLQGEAPRHLAVAAYKELVAE
mmetsp:Transcript_40251/g.121664  ORF Transcript_40251/g.121664 Transcript_40251/m.121664 type:complete len:314 (-) Transcript_40251:648-1589(-)